MPKLVVINKGLHYAGQHFNVGAHFEATEVDAGWLKKTRRAADPVIITKPMGEVATMPAPAPRIETVGHASTADGSEGADAPDESLAEPAADNPSKRQYRRRDLKAGD